MFISFTLGLKLELSLQNSKCKHNYDITSVYIAKKLLAQQFAYKSRTAHLLLTIRNALLNIVDI